jgi:hypothetical protein
MTDQSSNPSQGSSQGDQSGGGQTGAAPIAGEGSHPLGGQPPVAAEPTVLVNKGASPIGAENTALVQEGGQVRGEATRSITLDE